MGDAGSMFLGLTVVWLLTIGSQGENPAFRPVTALWLVAIPLMDMASIMNRRIKKGQSPFLADREHLHHIFMRAGFSAREALLIITCFSIFLSAIGIVGEIYEIAEHIMFLGFLIIYFIYSISIQHIWRIIIFIKQFK
jgi:UDP-GlcNAc:undecaprenyl-phosphate GlcNAc-1-phosphate transferase